MLSSLVWEQLICVRLSDTHSSISEMNFVWNVFGVSSSSDVCPLNSSFSFASLTRTRRTISPKYMPLIIFSNLQWCNNRVDFNKQHKTWISIMILTTVGWVVVSFLADIHDPQRMNLKDTMDFFTHRWKKIMWNICRIYKEAWVIKNFL